MIIKDTDKNNPSRFGILDVGGFTFEDVKNWSVWNDPEASSRGGQRREETQGNGGKAYSYRMFRGPSYILGVKNNVKNQVGFIGKNNSLERGLPRYYPASDRVVWLAGNKLNLTREEKDINVDDWIGVKIPILFFLPKIIYGMPIEKIPRFFMPVSIDFFPAKEPFDI